MGVEEREDGTVEISGVTCIGGSAKALLVLIDGRQHWIPDSQVHEDSEVWRRGDKGKLVVTMWIAEQKGLV